MFPSTIPLRWAATALTLVALAPLAPCQEIVPVDAPQSVLQPLDLRAGTAQNLALPVVPGEPFSVDVVLAGGLQTLSLRPFDVRASNFQLLVDDGKTLRRLPTPVSVTYRGTVVGMADTIVAAALIDGQLQAAVHTHDETWWIQPASDAIPGLPRAMHIVARHADSYWRGRCGVTQDAAAASAPVQPVLGPLAAGALSVAEVAIDVTNAAYGKMGSNTTTVNNRVTSLMNIVDTVFTRDVQITKTVVALIIRTSRVYSSTNTSLLGEVGTRWRNNHSNIRRDMVHALGGNPPGGILGIANLSVVCSNSRGVAVSWWWGSLNGHADLMAHEMGHNWSAPHCDGSNPCWTMCGGCALGQLRFAPVSVNRIVNHRNSRNCLGTPGPPTVTSIEPTSVTSHAPDQVTLTGTNLGGVTGVTVGGVPVAAFSVNGSSSISVTMPSPFEINTHSVVAWIEGLALTPMPITVTGNHPSVLVAPTVHFQGTTDSYSVHTDKGWLAAYFLATAPGASAIPGLVSLGIGAGFTAGPFGVVTLPAGNNGAANLDVAMPTGLQLGTFLYWQLVTYDPLSITVPLEVSNVATVVIF